MQKKQKQNIPVKYVVVVVLSRHSVAGACSIIASGLVATNPICEWSKRITPPPPPPPLVKNHILLDSNQLSKTHLSVNKLNMCKVLKKKEKRTFETKNDVEKVS